VIRSILVIIGFVVGWSFAFQSALYAACLYLWIAYFRPESWAWSSVFASLNLSFVAGIFLLVRTFFSPVRFRLDFRNGLLLLFLAHALLSSVVAPHPDVSLAYLMEFTKTLVISYLLSVLITNESEFRLVITVIALSLSFEAAKQGWAQLILNPGGANQNSVPFLGDNNLVAVGMCMLLPLIGALGSTSTGWWRRGFQFLSVGVLYRAISTYSRGGLLSVGSVGAIYFWRSPNKVRTIAAFTIAIALILPVLPPAYWDRMSTITASGEDRDYSTQGRLHFWRVAVAMANDRPFVGVGHRGYETAFDEYDWMEGFYGTKRAVHSAWFGILGDGGYPGLAIFVTLVLTSFGTCRRVRKSAQRGEIPISLGRYAAALESSLVAFSVGGAFVSFQYSEMLWHFFALTMALGQVAVNEAEAKRRVEAAPPAMPSAPMSTPETEPDFAWG
jgi:probable O-glycosylation ligase (exosortase A-associated)